MRNEVNVNAYCHTSARNLKRTGGRVPVSRIIGVSNNQ